ncbi:hypothetical protein [Neobacillus sp. PS3-40]|uniref:hypothetical protein n=1 Tax=Neobacillus sp. PS3-40 TaxID=3070679 RepID=UPI0027E18311|nr:hypothetical protein [Neobacillus sp. PS3-40]WML44771.1 hypothetical protein RCG20_02365 [Neobacillus sp. PS3-40]
MKIMSLLKKQPYMKMFTKKRSNKGAVWASIISLGATAAVWGMTKGKMRESKMQPLQNMFKSLTANKNIPIMNDAALTEFSEEFINKATNATNAARAPFNKK